MAGLKRLFVPVAVTAALVGMSVPASADPAPRPVEGPVAAEAWGPLVPVPIPPRRVSVRAAAISDLGHIAVAYYVVPRSGDPSNLPGYVLVRSPRGVWSAPHRLNPLHTVLSSVDLGFDGHGGLTAFWSSMTEVESGDPDAPPPVSTYAVATKPAHRRWSTPVRAGPAQRDGNAQDVVLSVAPSGKAVIGWRQFLPPLNEFQFTVRVRRSAGGAWGPARTLSAVSNRSVSGDVAINDHGTAIAAWQASRPWPAATGSVQRSMLTRSGAWTAPVTIGTNADNYSVRVAATPAGFTAITWVRPHNGTPQTVVDLRPTAGSWSRDVVRGGHYGLAVGAHRTVVLVGGARVKWRTNRSDWSTTWLTSRRGSVWALAPAVDSTGRIFVPWNQERDSTPQYDKALMSTHLMDWTTTGLWDWAPNTHFAAAPVSWNGRAVAIRRTVSSNDPGITTAVQTRVLRAG
jgi:hypothetical protein